MLPDNTLSEQAHVAGFSFPVKGPLPKDMLQDWELGGVGLNDASQGLHVKLWHCTLVIDVDTGVCSVYVSAPGVDATLLFDGEDITEVALAFDQNMNPFVAYMQGGDAKIYWYDPTLPGMTHTTLPAGVRDMRCTLDDKRQFNVANSDIVLAYIYDGNLCIRYQRERYETEYIMRAGVGVGAHLISMAMNIQSRLQFRLRNYALTSDPGALLSAAPFLAEVVQNLFERSDVKPENIDVSHPRMWVTIEGYRIANQSGADKNVEPLATAFFFDIGQWDKKIRTIPRGYNDPVAVITDDDLLERNTPDGPIEIERVQQIELLRKVNVTMVDSTAGWVTNKQTAERRLATIKAVGESSVIMPITATPDFTATVATKRLRVPWGEPNKFMFGLGVKWSRLVPTDVIEYVESEGRRHRIRIGQQTEDYGNFQLESSDDAAWIYKQTATGAVTRPSIPTVPGQVGDTVVIPMDLPVLRDGDDEFGYYVAAVGLGDGWSGGVAQMRLQSLGSPTINTDVLASATAGTTVTALLPEASSEYLSNQTLRVTLTDQPESVSRDQLFNMRNLMAVQRADGSWELFQFQTSTPIGNDTYDLSNLLRGRYNTDPLAIPVGARVVLIDDAVQFVKFQRWMLDHKVFYRGISYGQNPDDIEWEEFIATDPRSQDEWAPHYLRATRDGGEVTVTWIGRGRIGMPSRPYQSKYFDGYNVKYSDGPSYKVTSGTSHTRTGTPAGVTITVAGLNDLTGRIGEESEGITI